MAKKSINIRASKNEIIIATGWYLLLVSLFPLSKKIGIVFIKRIAQFIFDLKTEFFDIFGFDGFDIFRNRINIKCRLSI